MPKLITFKVPVQDRKTKAVTTVEKQGFVALLYVGNVQEKFVLQRDEDGECNTLAHYASGHKFGSLNPVKVRYWSSYSRMSDREAAKVLVAEAVERLGAEQVRQIMNTQPVLNV